MKSPCIEVIDRLPLSLSHPLPNLGTIHTELQAAIATLRSEIQNRTESLGKVDPTSPDFTVILGFTNEIGLTLETLVKAAADVKKLEAAATKVMLRVWKRLERHHRSASAETPSPEQPQVAQ